MDKEYVKIAPDRYNSLLEASMRLNMALDYIKCMDMDYLNAVYNTSHNLCTVCADVKLRDIIGYEMPKEVHEFRNKLIKEDREKENKNAEV